MHLEGGGYFEETYYYDGDDLGVTYTSNKSTFKVWSPVSKSIKLILFLK